ncbi:MAG TPA: hypothetical protein VF883_06460 [Thermoanaerobaculia bacterium]|jgi:hypothetical protein
MPSHRPDLIVPVRDRRARKRILTLKNFAIFVAVLVLLFAIITIRSEMRGSTRGDYGQLFGREAAIEVEQKPVEVVHEAPPPVDDSTHPDPMLTEPAARAQWLQDQQAAEAATIVPVTPAQAARVTSGSAEVAIVGGDTGVAVVRKDRKKPVLSGGFGR